jgi:hypothetical protein
MLANSFTAVTAAVFLFFPSKALAIIGESKTQCEARYGSSKPVQGVPTPMFRMYNGGSLLVVAAFSKDDKCESIVYVNLGKSGKEAFSDTLIQHYLKMNGGTKTWKELDKIGDIKLWASSDKTLAAAYEEKKLTLHVMTPDYAKNNCDPSIRHLWEKPEKSGIDAK